MDLPASSPTPYQLQQDILVVSSPIEELNQPPTSVAGTLVMAIWRRWLEGVGGAGGGG